MDDGPAANQVRLATPGDGAVVQTITAAAYVPAYEAAIGVIPLPAFEDYGPRIERGEVWLLETSDGPAGVAVLELSGDSLLIYSIAVSPGMQGRGYGRTLLAFADRRARSEGVARVRLFTNTKMDRNVRLYRSCGFTEIRTRPHPRRPGETLIDMEKTVGVAGSGAA